MSILPDYESVPGAGGEAADTFLCAVFYATDGIFVEVKAGATCFVRSYFEDGTVVGVR